ncbi:MAG: hypothetical protein A3G40_05580 [Deltaproteobacteria bacterium RIFCSPLOWO2_12_FULL_57_22]|nr:MAG: hypothetical protein A3G40_05580 [Deltaproteobacteria bacterium RIFCSPLOWO2_12_FULL_57_22]
MRGFSLALKLPLFLVLAVVLTAFCGTGLAIFIGRRIMREAAIEANVNSVQTYASAIAFYVENARSLLETTALGLPEIRGFAAEQLGSPQLRSPLPIRNLPGRSVARRILNHSQVFEYVMLLKSDGTVYSLEPYELEARMSHHNLAFAAWHKELLSAGKTVISNLHISPATQRPTVVIATPIYGPYADLVGIWAGGLRLKELSQIGRGELETGPPERFGYVTDGRGLAIAHQAEPSFVENQTDLSSLLPVRAALAGPRGTAQHFNPIDGHEELVAYTPLTDPRWAVVYEVPTEAAFAPLDALSRTLAMLSGVLAIILGVGGYAVVRRAINPLKKLTMAAERIGTGDLGGRVGITSGDEIGQLSRVFNTMAEALVNKDAQLRQRIEELRETNRELRAFTYSVSHDLRAPVRHMHGYAELLQKSASSTLDEKSRHYLATILDSGKQMTNLIDELLSFSRMGQAEMRKGTVSLDALLKEALKDFEPEMNGRSIVWKIDRLPQLYGDPTMLRLVLTNLVSNALKFTRKREDAKIEVGSMNNEQEEIVVFVRDNGVGFDMRYADKLFGIFQRLHREEEFEGTGIGLANVRRIIHRHGGRTWAEGSVDGGATFYFSLPTFQKGEQSWPS